MTNPLDLNFGIPVVLEYLTCLLIKTRTKEAVDDKALRMCKAVRLPILPCLHTSVVAYDASKPNGIVIDDGMTLLDEETNATGEKGIVRMVEIIGLTAFD